MKVNKRDRALTAREPFPWNPNIHCYYELDFMGDVIKPGDKVRFRNRRGVFTFRGWCHNTEKNVQWVNCLDNKTMQFRNFYMDELKCVIRPKKSRAKKTKVVILA